MKDQLEFEALWRIVDLFDANKISYMLTGSLALNFYGHPRATNDIDVVISVLPSDADRLVQLFSDEYYISEDAVKTALATSGMFNVIDNKSVFKSDLIVLKQDEFSQKQFSRRQKINLDGKDVWVISMEDLILAKLKWSLETGSEMQWRDITDLIRVRKGDLDWTYLRDTAVALGFKNQLESICEN